MKFIAALWCAAFCLLLNPAQAQYFEGKVVYKISVEGEGAEMMAAFLPESYTYSFKGSDILFQMDGLMGSMMGDILLKGEEGIGYMIKHSESLAYKINPEKDVESDGPEDKPEVQKLDETAKIAGYKCQKYRVISEGSTSYMWTTTELQMKQPKNASEALSSGGALFTGGVDGFPLKVVSNIAEMGGVSLIMEAKEVSKMKLDGKQFNVPRDYKVEDFDIEKMMQGGY